MRDHTSPDTPCTCPVASANPAATAPSCQHLRKVSDWDARISAAEASLQEMRQGRLRALSDVNHYHDVINRVPVEIRCEIFRSCLPPPELARTDNCTPIVLASVCHSWRTLCLAMPDLWAMISLRATFRNTHRSAKLLDLVKLWISRSKELPLTVIINMWSTIDPGEANVQHIISAINDESHRLTYLWVKAPGICIDMFDFGARGAPRLSSLSICSTDALILKPSFSAAPTQFELYVANDWNDIVYNSFANFGITPGNITEACLTGAKWDDFVLLIMNSPRLRSCLIHSYLVGPNPWDPPLGLATQPKPVIVHDALESLHLEGQGCVSAFFIIMDALTLPSLKDLRLVGNEFFPDSEACFIPGVLKDHLIRSSSRLESLSVCNFNAEDLSPEEMMPLLCTIAPSIRHLTIEPSVSAKFDSPADLFKPIRDCGATFPMLESLRVYGPPEWWLHTLQELRVAGEFLYSQTGRPVRMILHQRECSEWWDTAVSKLVGRLKSDSPEENCAQDNSQSMDHPPLPSLSREELLELMTSATQAPPKFIIELPTVNKGRERDVWPGYAKMLLSGTSAVEGQIAG